VAPIVSKLKGETLHLQTLEGIHNVMTFMETEARNKEPPIPIEKSQLRTVAASEVSSVTAQEIKGGTSSLDAAAVTAFSTSDRKEKERRNTDCTNWTMRYLAELSETFAVLKNVFPLLKFFGEICKQHTLSRLQ
jgi:hypothetical protein